MKVVLLSGGVGGARMARGFAAHPGVDLTVVVNVGDDLETHGLYVSPDLDTVLYTLAGLEGPHGWGRANDTFHFNEELGRFGVDNTFQLGDRDLALKLYRTFRIAHGAGLTEITAETARALGVPATVLPATNDSLRTVVLTEAGGWVTFQTYFVNRRHEDDVLALRFEGADAAGPAPGSIEAIDEADLVVIAPSNPPLSIWPILAVSEIRLVLERRRDATAVSPLIRGRPVKGPADRVMRSLGLPTGNAGVAAAYAGIIDRLVVNDGDAPPEDTTLRVIETDTLIPDRETASRLARVILEA